MVDAPIPDPHSVARRLVDLGRLSFAVRLGRWRADVRYWGWLGDGPWRNMPHAHSFHEVCYAHAGVGTFGVEGARHAVGAGDLFYARPHATHQIVADDAAGVVGGVGGVGGVGRPLVISFWAFSLADVSPRRGPDRAGGEDGSADPADALVDAFARSTRPVASGPAVAPVAATVGLLAGEAAAWGAGLPLAAGGLATKLILDTLRAGCDGPPPSAPWTPGVAGAVDPAAALARTVDAYLLDNLARPIGLADVAAQVAASERHTARLFRRATGTSILGRLTDVRLAHARALLAGGDLPVKRVARDCGYPDVRYFTTLFRRHVGRTPAAYRAAVQRDAG